jgi:hypothetical protein
VDSLSRPMTAESPRNISRPVRWRSYAFRRLRSPMRCSETSASGLELDELPLGCGHRLLSFCEWSQQTLAVTYRGLRTPPVPCRNLGVRRSMDTECVDFWTSLLVEVIGGIATAVMLGVGAALYAADQRVRRHDEAINDLYEDNRRWFRDRDRRVHIGKSQASSDLNARGLFHSGAWIQAMAIHQQGALHDYRDEVSAKRRRYRQLLEAEDKATELVRSRRHRPLRHLTLTDDERAVIASWRADIDPPHMPDDRSPIDDPTSEELEPDLRRFEREGDGPA